MNCKNCNIDISNKRSDALFCSDRCKKHFKYKNSPEERLKKIEGVKRRRLLKKGIIKV